LHDISASNIGCLQLWKWKSDVSHLDSFFDMASMQLHIWPWTITKDLIIPRIDVILKVYTILKAYKNKFVVMKNIVDFPLMICLLFWNFVWKFLVNLFLVLLIIWWPPCSICIWNVQEFFLTYVHCMLLNLQGPLFGVINNLIISKFNLKYLVNVSNLCNCIKLILQLLFWVVNNLMVTRL
jgi:hypothetical protein